MCTSRSFIAAVWAAPSLSGSERRGSSGPLVGHEPRSDGWVLSAALNRINSNLSQAMALFRTLQVCNSSQPTDDVRTAQRADTSTSVGVINSRNNHWHSKWRLGVNIYFNNNSEKNHLEIKEKIGMTVENSKHMLPTSAAESSESQEKTNHHEFSEFAL